MTRKIAAFACLFCLVKATVGHGDEKIDALDEGPSPALAKYVDAKDDSYAWTVRRRGKVAGVEYVELTLTSQTWRDIPWKHQLFLINPKSAPEKSKHGLLFITGGRWRKQYESPPGEEERLPREAALFATLAQQMKTPVAILLQVPQQPIFDGKYEDQIIAYSFEKFIRTGDSTWPLLLPMVKSAVRGMDAATEFAAKEWSHDLKTFTVTGASKRGWTTWLTGAVDQRATAIAPMVIDMLNMAPQMKHQKEAWGKFSYKINDYTERGLQDHLESEAGAALRRIVDPYSYRKLLKQPKLMILGTNDHYWPLDALNLYYDDLVGPKYILYVPNNRHGLSDYGRLTGSLGAIHRHAATGEPLPQLTWKFKSAAGRINLLVGSDQAPAEVRAWVAFSESRDFRSATWKSYPADKSGDGHSYSLPIPKKGFAALFGEAEYQGDGPLAAYFSTNVKILTQTAAE